jgi:hypothetical protein
MSPTVACALVVLSSGGFQVTSDLDERECYRRADAVSPSLYQCFEYVPGKSGVTMFADFGYRGQLMANHPWHGYPDLAACQASGSGFRPGVPWTCIQLAPVDIGCLLTEGPPVSRYGEAVPLDALRSFLR